jgi:(p)ppGpp synthase/HD superfamily hydrolase
MLDEPFIDLTPWTPTPTQLPEEWTSLAYELARHKSSPQRYGLKVKFNVQRVGDLLRSWGLPWQVVMAGFLWASDEKQIRSVHLQDVDQVLSHITQANRYLRAIKHEDLSLLLAPPYDDLGALLIATAISYQELVTIQQLSNNHPHTGKLWIYIESVGRTLLNVTKLLGMWRFKREVEDVTEQLRSPSKFAEMKQEREILLKHDATILEEIRQLFVTSYQQATQGQITVRCTPCGIAGMKRRQQDAHTTVTSEKTKLTGFDLTTFNIVVSTEKECYDAFGILSQLGYILDRVTDHIANPKPNGCSHIAFGLILKPEGPYTCDLDWGVVNKYVCQMEIATRLMQAILEYGCLHPDCYQLYTGPLQKRKSESAPLEYLWHGEEGRIYYAIQDYLVSSNRIHPDTNTPIVVYDKNRQPIALPRGATALDVAFALDSLTGEHAVDAIINNRKAPLYRMLDAGDVVEIITSPRSQIDESFLNHATTAIAHHQIKKSLRRTSPNYQGRELLYRELERYHCELTSEELDRELDILLKQHDLGTQQVYLEQLVQTGASPYSIHWAAEQIIAQIEERKEPLVADRGRSSWIPIPDMSAVVNKKLFRRSRLCNLCQPTYPRDMKIMGRLRKGKGELIVHKESCPHLLEHTTGYKPVLLPMTWQTRPATFKVGFIVIVQDRLGLLFDITRQLYRHQCNLLSIHASVYSSKEALIRFVVEVHEDTEVLDIHKKLAKIENVIKVEFDPTTTLVAVHKRLEGLREQYTGLSESAVIKPTLNEALATPYPRKYMLDNPFDISRPATGRMFFGRSEETERLEGELCEEERGKALILYGPRRSGKSSICKNFIEQRVRLPFWGVLFSLQNFTRHNEETILRYLSDAVSREFEKKLGRPAPDWQGYKDSDPQARFHRLLRECIAQVPDTRLILALDEFGGALESYEEHILDYRFFTYWKELMNEVSQLSLILALPTSSHNTLTSREFVNAFSFADNLPITFLDTESAQQLLVNPLQERDIDLFPSTLALAIKMTGRNPYYMALLGQHLIRLLNREPHKEQIADEDIHIVVEQIIMSSSSQNFDFLKKELQDENELRVLEAIVELTRHPGQSKVQLKRIAAWLKQPDFITRRYLDRLRSGLILQENGPTSNPYYTFTIELVQRWLACNRSFFLS